jgi:hypothetical protein
MRTVSGLFETYQQAITAVHSLEDAGIKTADISLIANSPEDLNPEVSPVGKDAVAGAEVGAILGGAGGLLAGLGMLAIPGLGPVLAGGWLVATLVGVAAGAGIGAATGGLVGLLTDAGIPKSDAQVYAEGVRRGGALVTARIGEAQVEAAEAILADAGAADLADRRLAYGFDPVDGVQPDIDAADPRERPDRYPLVPPIV